MLVKVSRIFVWHNFLELTSDSPDNNSQLTLLQKLKLFAGKLTSRYHGESETLCSMLFSVARQYQPCLIYIDELESLLKTRDGKDGDNSGCMKSILLKEIQKAKVYPGIHFIGATNRPEDIDFGFLRRFENITYCGYGSQSENELLLSTQLRCTNHNLSEKKLKKISKKIKGIPQSYMEILVRNCVVLAEDRVSEAPAFIRPIHSCKVIPCEKGKKRSLNLPAAVIPEMLMEKPVIEYSDVKIALADIKSQFRNAPVQYGEKRYSRFPASLGIAALQCKNFP